MAGRGLGRRLEKLEGVFGLPTEPQPDPEEFPLESWARSLLRESRPAIYGDATRDEEAEVQAFLKWGVEEHRWLIRQVGAKMRQHGYRFEEGMPPEVARRLVERVTVVFVPHLKHWWKRFEEEAPDREGKRRDYEEWRRSSPSRHDSPSKARSGHAEG